MTITMFAELGHILLITAFVVCALQTLFGFRGAYKESVPYMYLADRAAILQCILILGAFIFLCAVFVTSDFSVKLAASHSHSRKPLIYKISGVWGNHEGSMLLWVVILAIYGAMLPMFGKTLPMRLKARAIAVQGLLGLGFLGFLIFTSNPFERLLPVPSDGSGLNPVLQDPGLALHPPFLYLGYVGFSMSFSLACAALMEGKVDSIWAKWLRPWVLLAWSFLTIGITLGSLWAYYELGWGGWWMWDPVENVSFMPWLAGTALLHSIFVLGTRHILAGWTVLLAIMTFSLSLVGTFVVRSGVLVSVHAFAVDPKRGIYILVLLALCTGSALALYARRAALFQKNNSFEVMSKSGALVLNNIFLIVATIIIFWGTFYPLFIDAFFGDKITVAAPFFNMTFTPVMILLILVMGIGPLLKWDRNHVRQIKPIIVKLWPVLAIAFVISWGLGRSWGAALGLALAIYLALGTFMMIVARRKILKRQPAGFYGFLLAHMGMAVLTMAVTAMTFWGTDKAARLKLDETVKLAHYSFKLSHMQSGRQDNYEYLRGTFEVSSSTAPVKIITAEQRYYPVRDMVTTEAGFKFGVMDTVFAALSEGDRTKGWVVRVYYQPMVIWIWIGGLMMALGGFISLADRRLRFSKPDLAIAHGIKVRHV